MLWDPTPSPTPFPVGAELLKGALPAPLTIGRMRSPTAEWTAAKRAATGRPQSVCRSSPPPPAIWTGRRGHHMSPALVYVVYRALPCVLSCGCAVLWMWCPVDVVSCGCGVLWMRCPMSDAAATELCYPHPSARATPKSQNSTETSPAVALTRGRIYERQNRTRFPNCRNNICCALTRALLSQGRGRWGTWATELRLGVGRRC